ncbi:MAG TPA: hypothetical protein VN258_12510 [Mobilitalea sp.]|nr:hypothetical protein [Mobilitalea sp.]
MNFEQHLAYHNKDYKIIHSEQEFIVHPAAFNLLPLTKASLQCSFSSNFHIENYRLYLDKITLFPGEAGEKQVTFHNCAISYNGAILIGDNMIREYNLKGRPACFSYQNVIELVFEDGVLITSVDQSKAMLRIRKNLELSMRNLTRGRDQRCILRFMNSAFVGDYRSFKLSVARRKYIQEMKSEYNDKNFINNLLEA